MKSTNCDMADSTFFWGVAKTYRYEIAVMETSKKDELLQKGLNKY